MWAKEEIENFWSQSRNHVVTVVNCRMMAECVECARTRCSELLQSSQVNLIFHLDRLIHPDLRDEVLERLSSNMDEVLGTVEADDEEGPERWLLQQHNVYEYDKGDAPDSPRNSYHSAIPYNMTSSCAALIENVHKKMAELQPLTRFMEVYPAMLHELGDLIIAYESLLWEKAQQPINDIGDHAFASAHTQALAILTNLLVISDVLLVKLSTHLQSSFQGRPASLLMKQATDLSQRIETELFVYYALHRAAFHLGMRDDPGSTEQPMEVPFAEYAFSRIQHHREWVRAHPNAASGNLEDEDADAEPFGGNSPGMGHVPAEPVYLVIDGMEQCFDGEENVLKEPVGVRWPGGNLDLSARDYEIDNITVSPAFLQLHHALQEDCTLLSHTIGPGEKGMKLASLVLQLMVQEMNETMLEFSADGRLEIGLGGLQQLLVDITFLSTSAGRIASMEVLNECTTLMERAKMQAESQLGSDVVEREVQSAHHDDWLAEMAANAMADGNLDPLDILLGRV